jgi:hypothetical protein
VERGGVIIERLEERLKGIKGKDWKIRLLTNLM